MLIRRWQVHAHPVRATVPSAAISVALEVANDLAKVLEQSTEADKLENGILSKGRVPEWVFEAKPKRRTLSCRGLRVRLKGHPHKCHDTWE